MSEVQPSVSEGKRVCKTCHEEVEARHDEHCPFSGGPLTYDPDCPACKVVTEIMYQD